MSELDEIMYQIKVYDDEYSKNIPDEWRMSLDNGKHYGKATQVYDFTKHRYIVEYVSDNYDIHTEIQTLLQENKQLKRDKNIMQNYLQLIKDIGYDYDGYNDVKNLKELIDELCKYALCGIKLDDKKIISSSCEKYYNILGEEILGGKENER